jgi:hypothetical protein
MGKVDFGNLSREQTLAVFKEALGHLEVDVVATALKDSYGPDDMAELQAQLED